MNLRGQTAEKSIPLSGDSLTLAAVLSTNKESITCKDGTLVLPAYSIAVFTIE